MSRRPKAETYAEKDNSRRVQFSNDEIEYDAEDLESE